MVFRYITRNITEYFRSINADVQKLRNSHSDIEAEANKIIANGELIRRLHESPDSWRIVE